jgi:hypothetical protein
VARSSGAGSVVVYNYMDDAHVGYDPGWVEVGINGSHMVGSHHMLFKGNESFNYDSDKTLGDAIYHTVFRNRLSGFRRDYQGMGNTRAAGLVALLLRQRDEDARADERLGVRRLGCSVGRRALHLGAGLRPLPLGAGARLDGSQHGPARGQLRLRH